MLNFINHYDFLGKLQHYDPHCMSDCLSQLVFCLSHKTYLKSYDLIQYFLLGQFLLNILYERINSNPNENIKKEKYIIFHTKLTFSSKAYCKQEQYSQDTHRCVKNREAERKKQEIERERTDN